MWCGLYIAFKNRLISYVSEAENTGEKWKFSVRVESNRVCDATLARREFIQGSQSDFYIYIEREGFCVCEFCSNKLSPYCKNGVPEEGWQKRYACLQEPVSSLLHILSLKL